MVSNDVAKQIQAAEVARQTAPDKFCDCCLNGHGDGHGNPFKQVVKIGTICPACGHKVDG